MLALTVAGLGPGPRLLPARRGGERAPLDVLCKKRAAGQGRFGRPLAGKGTEKASTLTSG
jgi:hypothetical protein